MTCWEVLVAPPAPQLLPAVLEASVHCHSVPGDKAGVLQCVLNPHAGGTLCSDWIGCHHEIQMQGTEGVWHSQRGLFSQIPCSQVPLLAVEAHLPVWAPRKPPQGLWRAHVALAPACGATIHGAGTAWHGGMWQSGGWHSVYWDGME